ncbi:MAG: phosphoribosylglycinamide formyltransferase [Anaerolineae bacterium]|nr:phosphoribosylglycinamide formyltransferase [Anaerolineae bacterium]
MTRIAVLISGSGTNLQAIIDAVANGQLPDIEIAVVVSNRREAYGVKRAIQHGIPLVYFPLLPYTNAGRPRQEYDADLARILGGFGVEWVVLAGWMHIFTHAFVRQFPSHVLNLHPALPGTFPGTHAIERAFEAYQAGKIIETGVMVHLVPDEAVDAGPVVAQRKVPILPQDTLESLEGRIHETEHVLLVGAIRAQITGNPH